MLAVRNRWRTLVIPAFAGMTSGVERCLRGNCEPEEEQNSVREKMTQQTIRKHSRSTERRVEKAWMRAEAALNKQAKSGHGRTPPRGSLLSFGRKFKTLPERVHVLEILMAGGWAMLPILVCSAVAIAIILERFWSLRRSAVIPPTLGAEVREWARTRKLDPQHVEALRGTSPLGEILAAALSVRLRSRDIIKERVEDTGRHVVHRLERFLNTLGTIALISPLLGLLGTVFGLIKMFFAVMVSGVGDPLKMAGGIGEALVCTAAGLCVAIPHTFSTAISAAWLPTTSSTWSSRSSC